MRPITVALILGTTLAACATGTGPGGGGRNTAIRITNSVRVPNLRVTIDGIRGQPVTMTVPANDVPPYNGPIIDVAIDVQPGDPVLISVTAPGPLANDTTCTAGVKMRSVQNDNTTGFADVLVIVQGGTISFQCDVPNWQ